MIKMKLPAWCPMITMLVVSSLILYVIFTKRPIRTPVLNLEERDISKYITGSSSISLHHVTFPKNGALADNADALHIIPTDDVLNTLSNASLVRLYNDFLRNIHVLCRNKVRMGGILTGGWDLCLDGHYDMQKNNCLVYSLGMNTFNLSFDNALADTYGCMVHAYDPSINTKDTKHSQHVNLHSVGVTYANSKERGGLQMKTLQRVRKENGHENAIVDYMKIDIESHVWPSLQHAMKTDALDGVKQLAIEFHNFGPEKRRVYITRLSVLRDIYNSGYRIYWTYTYKNPYCTFTSIFDGTLRTRCHRVYFLKWITY